MSGRLTGLAGRHIAPARGIGRVMDTNPEAEEASRDQHDNELHQIEHDLDQAERFREVPA